MLAEIACDEQGLAVGNDAQDAAVFVVVGMGVGLGGEPFEVDVVPLPMLAALARLGVGVMLGLACLQLLGWKGHLKGQMTAVVVVVAVGEDEQVGWWQVLCP